MFTSVSATLTLLDSSAPEVRRTSASASATAPSFSRSRPSAPFSSCSVSGRTSLMRSTVASVSGPWPSGRMEMVPSAPTVMLAWGGTATGPPLPITGWPAPLVMTPTELTRRSPARV